MVGVPVCFGYRNQAVPAGRKLWLAHQGRATFTQRLDSLSSYVRFQGKEIIMNEYEEENANNRAETHRPTHLLRLPGFLVEEEIGLGDVIQRTTYAMGIKTCAGCEQRAATLNRWMRFTR
jgi:hypothetical protein